MKRSQIIEKILAFGLSSETAVKASLTYAPEVLTWALREFELEKFKGRLPEYMFWKEVNFQAGIYLDKKSRKKDFTGIGKHGLIKLDRPLPLFDNPGDIFK